MERIDWQRLKQGEVNLGTTIFACAFKDGVVIGADSRTTTGSYIVRQLTISSEAQLTTFQANRVTDKLTCVHDRIYCCRSGSAADTQAVADVVTYQLQLYAQVHGHAPPVHVAANMFQALCYSNKDQLSAGILVAGWDETDGPAVYNIPLGGGLFKGPWAIGGSGSSYIYGYCDSTYREGWGRDETVEFARNAISLAMARDGSSGGTIRMCVITKEGVERIFVPGNELPFNGGLWGSKPVKDVEHSAPIQPASAVVV